MAHPRLIAQRQAIAVQRLMAAAHKLAQKNGLKEQAAALDAAVSRDPAMAQMLQAEALADLLEGLTGTTATAPKVPAEAEGPVTIETVEVVEKPAKAGKEK